MECSSNTCTVCRGGWCGECCNVSTQWLGCYDQRFHVACRRRISRQLLNATILQLLLTQLQPLRRAVSCVKKTWTGRKLQFSDRQLQISDRGNCGCLKFQFCPHISPKWRILAPNCVFLEENVPTYLNLGGGLPSLPPPPPSHDATHYYCWALLLLHVLQCTSSSLWVKKLSILESNDET